MNLVMKATGNNLLSSSDSSMMERLVTTFWMSLRYNIDAARFMAAIIERFLLTHVVNIKKAAFVGFDGC